MNTLMEKHEAVIYSHKSRMGSDSFQDSGPDFQLINLMEALPLIPTPWISIDNGEGFIWGKFIILLQKEPLPMIYEMQKHFNENVSLTPMMKYLYSMSVFYHPDYEPSSCPILALSIEQCTLNLGLSPNVNPLFIGMFHREGLKHTNYGEYKGEMTPSAVKECLFSILGQCLQLDGNPRLVGTIKETVSAISTMMDRALHNKVQDPQLPPDEKAWYQDLEEMDSVFSGIAAGSISPEEAAQFDEKASKLLKEALKQKTRDDFSNRFPSMDIFKYPSMPMPFSSIDDGEVFLWDGCFCIFQKQSKIVAEVFAYDKIKDSGMEMRYQYAMAILRGVDFFRFDRVKASGIEDREEGHISQYCPLRDLQSARAFTQVKTKEINTPQYIMLEPLTSSPQPILVVGIEECILGSYQGPPMLGMFFKGQHYNFGQYNEPISPDNIRSKFFDIIKTNLDLKNDPELIGTIPQIFPNMHKYLLKE